MTSRGPEPVVGPAADRRAAVLLVVTMASFGATWVAAPWATDELPPLTVACLRFALAAALLTGWCAARGLPLRISRRDIPVIVGQAATGMVAYNVLFLYGVTLAPASHGAVIVPGIIPIATLALTRWRLAQPIGRNQIFGSALSIGGLALVVGPELGGGADIVLGDALFFVSAGLWAGYTLLGRSGRSHLDPAVLTTFVTGTGALVFLPLAMLQPGGAGGIGGASPLALGSVVYLGSIGTALSFVTFLAGVRLIGAAKASAYTVLVPLFGVSLTVALLGEPFGPLSFVGAAVVIAGLWLTQAAPPPAAALPPAAPPAAQA